jgi:D-alanine-D-alanine ligase
MRILIVYNVATRLRKGVESDLTCEHEITVIVPIITKALQRSGHRVDTLLATLDLWEELRRRRSDVDLILNCAEAFGGGNSDEPTVPAILEAMEMPFTGASLRNMVLTLDKEVSKLLVREYGVPVPAYQLFRSAEDALSSEISFPAIVKPVREEASIGISNNSIVRDAKSLRCQVQYVLDVYRQPALVEAFIAGREISVGVVGNEKRLTVLPPLEFLFTEDSPGIRSYDYKWGGRKEEMVQAELPVNVHAALVEHTRAAFVATECRDYARMDFRLDEHWHPWLIEVNCNPGIGPNSHGLNNTLTRMASFAGYSYESFVELIVSTAAAREARVVR